MKATTSDTQQLLALRTDGTYEIAVTAVNATGESELSTAISIVVAIPPALLDPPSLLTSEQTITNGSLTIEWTTVPGATSYNVYVNGTLNATTSITQQLIELGTNGTYEITVTAVNATGESEQSTAISIVVAIPPGIQSSPVINLEFLILTASITTASITAIIILARKRKKQK